jgi:putative transposase
MVRAGVVSHPAEWPFSGYNEIQAPRRKNVLIDYERLQGLLGSDSYNQLKRSHKGWVEEHLGAGARGRRDEWTGSIAVGIRSFIESVKERLGVRAKGRDVVKIGEDYQLRESPTLYNALFEAENEDIAYISHLQKEISRIIRVIANYCFNLLILQRIKKI